MKERLRSVARGLTHEYRFRLSRLVWSGLILYSAGVITADPIKTVLGEAGYSFRVVVAETSKYISDRTGEFYRTVDPRARS